MSYATCYIRIAKKLADVVQNDIPWPEDDPQRPTSESPAFVNISLRVLRFLDDVLSHLSRIAQRKDSATSQADPDATDDLIAKVVTFNTTRLQQYFKAIKISFPVV